MFYLGCDFLENAVTARQKLLSKCLIAVPCHLENVDLYLHRVKLSDETYRYPWKRARVDDSFWTEDTSDILKDVALIVPDADCEVGNVELFASNDVSADSSLGAAVTFELDCDVVPSSNPSSADICSPEDDLIEQALFLEHFIKEDLNLFTTDCEKLYIEEHILNDHNVEYTKPSQSLHSLASELVPLKVTDPLKSAKAHLIAFSSRALQLTEGSSKTDVWENVGNQVIKDRFEKYADLHMLGNKQIQLEIPLSAERCLPDLEETFKSMEGILQKLTSSAMKIDIKEVDSLHADMTDVSKAVAACKALTIEKFSASSVETKFPSFLGVNEPILTMEDRFCENAFLATPEQSPTVHELEQHSCPLPNRGELEIDNSDRGFLTKPEVRRLWRRCWQSEKFCGVIQASRLSEPDVIQDNRKKQSLLKEAKRTCCLAKDSELGKLELQLSWELHRYDQVLLDPTRQIVRLATDGPAFKVCLKDVETVQKYSPVQMYDMVDSFISFEQKSNKRQSSGYARFSDDVPEILPIENNGTESVKKVVQTNEKERLTKVGFDPLGDFMALRLKVRQENAKDKAPSEPTDATITEPQNPASQIAKIKKTFEGKKQVKHHIVRVRITDEIQEILDVLESTAAVYMENLIQSGNLSTGSTFQSITPDVSRFLLKQKEKCLVDCGMNAQHDEVYRSLVCLHALSGTAEILVNCCLESAIAYLAAVHDKYKTLIAATLDNMRQHLFEIKARQSVHHPKVGALCKEVEIWFKKKMAKSKDNEHKILILVRREMPSLMDCLKSSLGLSHLLVPDILTTTDSEKIIASLEKHNCLVVQQHLITESFPWAQFSLVVEYEHQDKSMWQQLCHRQKIRHISLQTESLENTELPASTRWAMKYPDRQIVLIGSQNVTKNTDLLQLLEARYNVMLVERDYELLIGARHLFFSDLDVDENAAIVLQCLQDMVDDCAVQNLVTKTAALSVKYTHVWVLIVSNSKSGRYQLPGHVVSNLSRLHAAIANLVLSEDQIFVKILYCDNTNEVASLIRHISERRMAENNSRPVSNWLQRSWLTQEISQMETFLLMLPCVSSFNAQLLIKDTNLRSLFSATSSQLHETVPWIAQKTIKNFVKLATSMTGLHLRDIEMGMENAAETSGAFTIEMNGEVKHCIMNKEPMTILEDFQNKPEESEVGRIPDIKASGSNKNSDHFDKWKGLYDQMGTVQEHLTFLTGKKSENTPINISEEWRKYKLVAKSDNENFANEFEGRPPFNAKKIVSGLGYPDVPNYFQGELADANKHFGLTPVKKLQARRNRNAPETRPKRQTNAQEGNKSQYFRQEGQYLEQRQKAQVKEHHTSLIEKETGKVFQRSDERSLLSTSSVGVATPLPSSHTSRLNLEALTDRNCISNANTDIVPFQSGGACARKQEEGLQHFMYEQYRSGCNPAHSEQREMLFQNEIGLSAIRETFEYNHGLDVKDGLRNSTPQVAKFGRSCPDYIEKDPILRNRIRDFEKEFPPAEEIDRSFSIERNGYTSDSKENAPDPETNRQELMTGTLGAKPLSDIVEIILDHQSAVPEADKISVHANKNTSHGNSQSMIVTHSTIRSGDNCSMEAVHGCHASMVELSSQQMNMRKEVTFKFSPFFSDTDQNVVSQESAMDLIKKNSDRQNCSFFGKKLPLGELESSYIQSGQLYINPSMDRITLKPNCVNSTRVHPPSSMAQSLEDDVRQTTKKFLENSQQFSRFGCNKGKHPLRNVSIGLAQPLQRQKSAASSIVKSATVTSERQGEVSSSELDRMRMARSPWACENSPPMDLDYENIEITNALYPIQRKHSETERSKTVFTSQMPSKKRRLTYQHIPGRKGQTKLVFK